jgi:hypothetical protein
MPRRSTISSGSMRSTTALISAFVIIFSSGYPPSPWSSG